MKTRLLLGFFCLVVLMMGSAKAQETPPPGSPFSSTVTWELDLYDYTSPLRLPTVVIAGDVVLLKQGDSQERSNWASLLRFTNEPFREAEIGYARLTHNDGTNFPDVTLADNLRFVTWGGNPEVTTYTAEGATYRIHGPAQVIPEPCSATLVGIGAISLAAALRGQRNGVR